MPIKDKKARGAPVKKPYDKSRIDYAGSYTKIYIPLENKHRRVWQKLAGIWGREK